MRFMLLSLFVLAGCAWGADLFPNEWNAVPIELTGLKRVELIESNKGDWQCRFQFAEGRDGWISVRGTDGVGVSIDVFREGQQVLACEQIVDFSFCPGFEIFSADFNLDQKPDFMVSANYGGCGLAAGYCRLGFILSDGETFQVRATDSLRIVGVDEFMLINGHCVILYTDYYPGENLPHGIDANYLVHHLVTVDGVELQVDGPDYPEFPRIVPYQDGQSLDLDFHLSKVQRQHLIDATKPRIQRVASSSWQQGLESRQ
jgi:hypothetical protein